MTEAKTSAVVAAADAERVTVREVRAAYLNENGFTTDEYTSATFRIQILGRERAFRNPPNRQWAIALHDLHHVATGYGTDFVGEGEIAAWELGAGCVTPIVYVLNLLATAIGLVLAPLRVLRAGIAGLRCRSLYRQSFDREALLDGSVAALRARLGVPLEGLARGPRRLHAGAETARARAAEVRGDEGAQPWSPAP